MSRGSEAASEASQTNGDDAADGPPSSAGDPSGEPPADAAADAALDREELTARLDLLREENRRLRREYARARRSQYRRSALGLGLVGALALVGGILFPANRVVLFALAGTGLFAAVLTYYLTPERLVPVSVGRSVYGTLAAGFEAISADLGLAPDRVYVPTVTAGSEAVPDERDVTDGDPGSGPVRLFLPHRSSFTLPPGEDLEPGFVVSEDPSTRGVALTPVGAPLFDEFERAVTGPIAADPAQLAEQLGDALVEQFELVDSARVDAGDDTEDGGAFTVGISGSAYGPLDRFDHPVVSFLAVGAANAFEGPVTVTVADGDDRVDGVVAVERYSESESASERASESAPESDTTDGEAA